MGTFSKNNGKNFQRTNAKNFFRKFSKKKECRRIKKKSIPRTGLGKNFEDIPTKTSFCKNSKGDLKTPPRSAQSVSNFKTQFLNLVEIDSRMVTITHRGVSLFPISFIFIFMHDIIIYIYRSTSNFATIMKDLRFVYGILIDKQQAFIVEREKIEKIESTDEKRRVGSLPSKNLDFRWNREKEEIEDN